MVGDSFLHRADAHDDGQRLDRVMRRLRPDLSRRGAGRCLTRGLTLVNGKTRPAHYRVRAGDTLTWPHNPDSGMPDEAAAAIRLLRLTDDFAFWHKPAGLHTATVSGSPAANLEETLRRLRPDLALHLLTRLDRETSGIVACARRAETGEAFRTLEREGRMAKYYLAQVRGVVPTPLELDAALETDSRRRTRVASGTRGDRLTLVEPLPEGDILAAALWGHAPTAPATLVLVRIGRGARHQIRAHLADAGFPVLGDSRYGNPDKNSETGLRLHHACMVFAGAVVWDMPECGHFTEALKGRIGQREE